MYKINKIFSFLKALNWLTISCFMMVMLSCTSKPDKSELSRKLAAAVSQNDISTVNELIDKGADINSRTVEGCTLLGIASSSGFDLIAKTLIQKKADMNAACNDESTPLMLVAKNGHISIAALLIDSGADINKVDKFNRTALMLAIENGHDEIAVSLVDHCASLAAQNKLDGSTSLLLAAYKNKTPLIKLLIAKHADVFAVDNNGYDILMHVSKNNNIEAVQIALDKGVTANRVAKDGYTAADLARSNNDIVKLIINKTLEKEGWSNYFTEQYDMYYLNSSNIVSKRNIHKATIRYYNLETYEYSETSLELNCRNRSYCYKSFQSKELGMSPSTDNPIIIYEKNNCGELNDKMELVSLAVRVCK